MLNLGLNALTDKSSSVNVLSYEYLDSVMMYNEACEEVNVVLDQFDQLCVAYDNLVAIKDVIHEHGVTPALEALVGGNFSGGFSLEEVESAENGTWQKIKDFLVTVWEAIKNFFARFFTSTFGLNERLKKRVEELKSAKEVTANSFNGIDVINVHGTTLDIAEVMRCFSDATGNKQMDPEDLDSEKPVLKEQKLTKETAVKYGSQLLTYLEKAAKVKSSLDKTFDEKIKNAKNLKEGSKEEVEKLKKEAKAAKGLLIPWAKAMHTSAAGFLSHVHAGKGSSSDESKSEEKKPEENKPEENKPEENKQEENK